MAGLFRIGALIEKAVQALADRELYFELYDVTDPQNLLRMHLHIPRSATGIGIEPQKLQQQVVLDVPGRNWILTTYATPEFLERYHGHTSELVLAVGLVFSTITSLYLFTVLRRKAKIVQLAEELNASNRALEATGRRLGNLIEAAPMAIMAVDSDNNLTNWNPAAETIFGWKRDEVLGGFPPHMDTSDAEHYRPVEHGEVVTGVEGLRRRKDGSEVYVRASGAPLLDGMTR